MRPPRLRLQAGPDLLIVRGQPHEAALADVRVSGTQREGERRRGKRRRRDEAPDAEAGEREQRAARTPKGRRVVILPTSPCMVSRLLTLVVFLIRSRSAMVAGMQGMIRILGVDPGLRHTGWGVITLDGPRLGWVAHGVIKPDPGRRHGATGWRCWPRGCAP